LLRPFKAMLVVLVQESFASKDKNTHLVRNLGERNDTDEDTSSALRPTTTLNMLDFDAFVRRCVIQSRERRTDNLAFNGF
jgi:hypothetical protein